MMYRHFGVHGSGHGRPREGEAGKLPVVARDGFDAGFLVGFLVGGLASSLCVGVFLLARVVLERLV